MLALGLLAFGVSTAQASGEPDIPLECGNRAAFEQQLRQRLGRDAPLSDVQVVITRAPGRAHLRVRLGADVRELDDPSCTELFRAAVVVAVAMLDHEPPPASAAPSSDRAPRSYPRLSLGAGVGVHVGTLPKPVLALELETKALWRHFGAAAAVRYSLPADKTVGDKGVELRALGVAVNGIFRPSPWWEARLGFAAQRLAGSGTGTIAQPGSDSAWAAGPTLGLALLPLQTKRFWAGLGAEGQLNAVRGRFQILHYYRPASEDPYVVYPVPWLAGSAFVRFGLVW
ncbi:MAG TPA: hypothetical protein VEQ58_05200 [Polyangiaceae bacterium]|nr:hypothetical protein [Polyangiaceae bacterium]